MTLDEIAEEASDKIHEAWVVDLLAESYDIAMRCEEDPLGWHEGRAKW